MIYETKNVLEGLSDRVMLMLMIVTMCKFFSTDKDMLNNLMNYRRLMRNKKFNMSELAKGTTVRLTNGRTCRIKKELVRGGQGIVYAVDYGGRDHALKWYTAQGIINSRAFYRIFNNNVKAGSPIRNRNFDDHANQTGCLNCERIK